MKKGGYLYITVFMITPFALIDVYTIQYSVRLDKPV